MAEICPTSMYCPWVVMMSREPTVRMKTMLKYMHRLISGLLSATIRSAYVKSLRMLSEAAANLLFSYSSRAKPFTTRIPRTFSSTDSLSRSYLRNTARKAGIAFWAISSSPATSTGMTTTKVMASRPPMRQAITIENTNISGARTAMRMAIIKAIWTLVMSVVRRVTREAVEKRSMFSKEKRWMRSNTSRRTLRAKPAEARAPV